MRRSGVLVALLLLVAGLSWWLAERQPEPPAHTARQHGSRTVDYTVSGLDVTRMTPAGVPAHRLHTPRLQHFADDDTTELATPSLTVFQDGAPPWQVNADQAWVSPDGSLVLLQGDVLITRAAGPDRPPVRIATRDLRVQPAQDYAETDEAVRVESAGDTIDAVGMQAWLRPPSRLKFLDQVVGHYAPR